jgi:hypothetical protein
MMVYLLGGCELTAGPLQPANNTVPINTMIRTIPMMMV